MSTHDYVIANQNGANTRSDLNNALSAIVSNNSSASEPSTTYAYMWWADTTNDLLKQRNAADSAWINILTLSTGVPVAGAADFSNGGDTAGADRTIGNNDAYAFGIETGGVERVKWDTSGNMGLGVVPESWHSSYTALQIGNGGHIASDTDLDYVAIGGNVYKNASGIWNYQNTATASILEQRDGKHTFKVAPSGTADSAISWTTAMTIDNSGRTMLGSASTNAQLNTHYNGASEGKNIICNDSDTGGGSNGIMAFNRNGSEVGYISTTTTATAYNTSSDYRLKENVVPMTGSIDRLKALKPSRFNFIADADTTVDGFLAHEAGEVVPEAATGTKDAMRTEEYEVTPALGEVFTPAIEASIREVTPAVIGTPTYYDIDGNVLQEAVEAQNAVHEAVEAVAEVVIESNVEKPEQLSEGQQWREVTPAEMGEREVEDYQGIDQSKLVPLLVAAVQELTAKVEALETAQG